MQKLTGLGICLLLAMAACQSDEKELMEQKKLQEQRAQVFQTLQNQWNFPTEPANATSAKLVAEWDAWRNFLRALEQKPQHSIPAAQKKATELGNLALVMQNSVPIAYNTPAVRARISLIVSKLNQLQLQLERQTVPETLAKQTMRDISQEILSLQSQLEEIDRRAAIPTEWGESDLVRMRDTSRALPANGAIEFDE